MGDSEDKKKQPISGDRGHCAMIRAKSVQNQLPPGDEYAVCLLINRHCCWWCENPLPEAGLKSKRHRGSITWQIKVNALLVIVSGIIWTNIKIYSKLPVRTAKIFTQVNTKLNFFRFAN